MLSNITSIYSDYITNNADQSFGAEGVAWEIEIRKNYRTKKTS